MGNKNYHLRISSWHLKRIISMSFTNTPYKKQGNWNRTGTGYIYMYICVSTYTHICIETLPILKEAIVVKLEHLLLDSAWKEMTVPACVGLGEEWGCWQRECLQSQSELTSGACWGPPMASHSLMKEKIVGKYSKKLHVASELHRKYFPPRYPQYEGSH